MYMSDTLNLANSIWPNGMKVDSDGHAVFYPLGTNKIGVPTSLSEWPKGNKLVSPFVYQDDKLVGFVDTKALTVSKNTTIYLPYEHIEAEFSAINKGLLQIHAPNATTKKASWKNSGKEDIPEAQFKYKGCSTLDNVKTVDANYKTTDIVDGVWSEPLWDLEDGNPTNDVYKAMFYNCSALTAFSTDLPSLTTGDWMFYNTNITSFSSDLSSLTNGREMFAFCMKLTSFTSDLSSLTNGNSMFQYCKNLSEFDTDLPNLTNGDDMFQYCSLLESFSSDLSSLTDVERMFYYCKNLKTFSSHLPNLTDGRSMFQKCSNLTSFTADLSSLMYGEQMFYNTNLSEFDTDLPNLINGVGMFNNCPNLTSFTADLSSLTNGIGMFDSCKKLTTFNSDLSSLTDGNRMFADCKLDTPSVQNIADTINTYNGTIGTIHIGIGNSEPNEQEETAFNTMVSKGWTVYVNGSLTADIWNPTALTPIDGEEIITPIPFWAKPVQSDEENAKYVDEQGNYYNILGAQFIYGDDISTYGMFTCEEDAAANMRLTPYIKPIEN